MWDPDPDDFDEFWHLPEGAEAAMTAFYKWMQRAAADGAGYVAFDYNGSYCCFYVGPSGEPT